MTNDRFLLLIAVAMAALTFVGTVSLGLRLWQVEQWRTGIGQRVTRLEEVVYP